MSFKTVQKKIASQGHSMESAGAILADSSRNASAAAKRANPKLKRVKGGDNPAMKSPMSVEGGKARTAYGVMPPDQEPRIPHSGTSPARGVAPGAKSESGRGYIDGGARVNIGRVPCDMEPRIASSTGYSSIGVPEPVDNNTLGPAEGARTRSMKPATYASGGSLKGQNKRMARVPNLVK